MQLTHDISHLSCADLFTGVGKRTPVATRLSTVIHEKGSPETMRDVRGFATKFYTQEGNWDLVGEQLPTVRQYTCLKSCWCSSVYGSSCFTEVVICTKFLVSAELVDTKLCRTSSCGALEVCGCAFAVQPAEPMHHDIGVL